MLADKLTVLDVESCPTNDTGKTDQTDRVWTKSIAPKQQRSRELETQTVHANSLVNGPSDLPRKMPLEYFDPLLGPVLRNRHFQPGVYVMFWRVGVAIPHGW